jgi:hypothetical protein
LSFLDELIPFFEAQLKPLLPQILPLLIPGGVAAAATAAAASASDTDGGTSNANSALAERRKTMRQSNAAVAPDQTTALASASLGL